jgi:hypothetical protein
MERTETVSETSDTTASAGAVVRPAAGDESTSPALREPSRPLSTDPDDLEAHIEQTRLQLAATIDQIADRVHPKNVARRSMDRARTVMVDEYGELRPDRVAIVGGVAVALVGLVLLRRSRARR